MSEFSFERLGPNPPQVVDIDGQINWPATEEQWRKVIDYGNVFNEGTAYSLLKAQDNVMQVNKNMRYWSSDLLRYAMHDKVRFYTAKEKYTELNVGLVAMSTIFRLGTERENEDGPTIIRGMGENKPYTDYGEINAVSVLPAYRNQGVSSGLMKFVIADAFSGVRPMDVLEIKASPTNENHQKIIKHGFRVPHQSEGSEASRLVRYELRRIEWEKSHYEI